MSQIEEAKGGWPPHDSLSQFATHAPIQSGRQPDNAQGMNIMPQGAWNFPVPTQIHEFVNRPALYGPEWQAQSEWAGKSTEWNKWSSAPTSTTSTTNETVQAPHTSELHRPLPTFSNAISALMPPPTQANVKEEPASPHYDGKSTEHNTNSYDGSASQSPHNNANEEEDDDEEEELAHSSEEIEVDYDKTMTADEEKATTKNIKTEMRNEEDEEADEADRREVQVDTQQADNNNVKKEDAKQFEPVSMEDTQLLLSLSQPNKPRSPSPSAEKPSTVVGFSHSGNSAFSNIDSCSARPVSLNDAEATAAGSSFCRPPGLGPVNVPPPSNGQAAPLVCPICGFSCPSKFHYNSHMNTHGDHQCSMCDYTSRTEGRLKKHMRESHTAEEQMRAGIDVERKNESNPGCAKTPDTSTTTSSEKDALEPPPSSNLMINLSTTMASILDSTASALAATMAKTESKPTFTPSLNLGDISTPNLLSSLSQQSSITTSALDQIRAFTENQSLIPDGGLSLASALGAVSQAIGGEPKTPEKSSGGDARRSSSGKVKILKCKQCGHQSLSKDEQWAHARTHIPAEKQLNCKHCNFVTEYKHHLEYHYRNHSGSKPFQCKKCSYTCVNKSMLNSHMKSHTNHYQFRCMDCTYATKYCHSLKLHLKKYNHRRVPEGADMNGGDSSPSLGHSDNVSPYNESKGTPSTSISQQFGFSPIVTSQSLNYASQMLLKQHQMDGSSNSILSLGNLNGLTSGMALKCPMCDYQSSTQEDQMRHNMSHFMNGQTPTSLASLYNSLSSIPTSMALTATNTSNTSNDGEHAMEVDEHMDDNEHDNDHEGSGHAGDDEMEHSSDCANSPTGSSKGSSDEEMQKRKAYKLEQISQRLQGKSPSSSESVVDKEEERRVESSVSPSEPMSDPSPAQISMPVASLADAPLMINTSQSGPLNNLLQQAAMAFNALNAKREENAYNFICPHCRMAFQDQALYHIHMGYHGYEHAFKCNRCGFTAADSLNFNLHLLQASHE